MAVPEASGSSGVMEEHTTRLERIYKRQELLDARMKDQEEQIREVLRRLQLLLDRQQAEIQARKR